MTKFACFNPKCQTFLNAFFGPLRYKIGLQNCTHVCLNVVKLNVLHASKVVCQCATRDIVEMIFRHLAVRVRVCACERVRRRNM